MATGHTSDDFSTEEEYDLTEDTSDEEKELVEGFHNLSVSDQVERQDFSPTELASKVETKYDTLQSKLRNLPENVSPEQRPVFVFYHVTTPAAKKNIKRQGILKANVSSQPTRRTASPIDKMKIAGVHFRLNNIETTSSSVPQLPTTSPFGTKRISIPISYFSEYELFFNNYNKGNPKTSGGHEIYYVSFVLVKPSHHDYNLIKKVLKPLDPEGNEFVYFEYDQETYYYYDYYTLKELQPGEKRRKSFNVYYEIVVIGDIEFSSMG